MKNTEEIILDRALELFNEKGVEYGGMRELASLLGMRVSNITYYFATKDDLIAAIAERLAVANGAIIQQHNPDSVRKLLEMYSVFFHNQYQYRCLLISFVHLFNHHPGVAEQYKGTEKKRRQSSRGHSCQNAVEWLFEKGSGRHSNQTDRSSYFSHLKILDIRSKNKLSRQEYRGDHQALSSCAVRSLSTLCHY